MPKLTPAVDNLRATNIAKRLHEKNGNAAAVAKELGCSRQNVNQTKKRPAVRKALQQIINKNLKKAGISTEKVYSTLADELEANKVISCNVIASDGEGMKDANSMTKDFVDVPDWQARDKALDKCLKLMGHIKQPGVDEGPSLTNINVFYGYRTNPRASTVRT